MAIGMTVVFLFSSIAMTIPIPCNAMTEELEDFYIQTPHPYTNNYNKEWTYTRSGATQIYIHFQKIETEYGWDKIYLRDGAGNLVQTIQGNYPDGLYSNWISGNTIKIQFVSDSSVVYYGFFINHFGYYNTSLTVESPHLTGNNYDYTWTIKQYDYTSRMRVRFATIDTENGWDYIHIRDENNNIKATYTGSYTNIWTDFVIGNTIKVQFKTDSSVQSWGFKVDCVDGTEGDDDITPTEFTTFAVGDYQILDDLYNDDVEVFRSQMEFRGYDRRYSAYDHDVAITTFSNADSGDFMYFTGHGEAGAAQLYMWWIQGSYFQFDHGNSYYYRIGEDDNEWMVFMACKVMNDPLSHLAGFVQAGGHMVLGYRIDSDDGTDEDIAQEFVSYLMQGYEIDAAFAQASHNHNQNGVTTVYHDQNANDHLWGHGVVYEDSTGTDDVYKSYFD